MTSLSFGSYFRKIFKTSLVTSFSEIATTKSGTKRLVKMLVFLACTIGFWYQMHDFLEMYFAYPTVVNVDITNPFTVEQPGLTVCNFNRRRLMVVCTHEPNHCISIPSDLFCHYYPMRCIQMDPKKSFLETADLFDLTETDFDWVRARKESHNDSMFRHCIKNIEVNVSRECNTPYLRVPVILEGGGPNYCYSVESQYGQPNAKPDVYANFFTLHITLNTQPEEYLIPNIPILMRVALHDRKAMMNPFDHLQGYNLKGGVEYTTYVSMVSHERLPYPYDTNCTDYLKKWRENNGTGPLNEMMCVEQCKLKLLLKRGLCIDKTVMYPHEEQLCSPINGIAPSAITESMLKDCYSECGNACSEIAYEAQFIELDAYDNMCALEDIHCKHSFTGTTLNFKKFRHTTYKSEPKFESVEVFSYLGGYMGVWLGLSFITVFDLLETFCYLLFFPINRRIHKRRKNRLAAVKQHGKNFSNNSTTVY